MALEQRKVGWTTRKSPPESQGGDRLVRKGLGYWQGDHNHQVTDLQNFKIRR